MGKISNYARVLVSKLTDVFVVDQTDNGTTATKSATVEQIGTAIGKVQTFADLDTSDETIVGGINEVNGNVGDLSTLTTTSKSSLVGAVNEVNSGLTNATTKTSGTISAGTGCVVRLGSLRKINGVVYGSFAINMTNPISSRTTIGNIPAGFRPSDHVSFIAPSSSAINYFQDRITNVIITPAGDIIAGDIFVPAGQTVKEIMLAFAYNQGS